VTIWFRTVNELSAPSWLQLSICLFKHAVKSGITSAITLASCHGKGGATLLHCCQQVTSYQKNQPFNRKLLSRASTRISEWLPQIAHLNIFIQTHKNAYEPAGILPQWQNSGSSCVKCYGKCNTALRNALKKKFCIPASRTAIELENDKRQAVIAYGCSPCIVPI
jgi:hypothetical protein